MCKIVHLSQYTLSVRLLAVFSLEVFFLFFLFEYMAVTLYHIEFHYVAMYKTYIIYLSLYQKLALYTTTLVVF